MPTSTFFNLPPPKREKVFAAAVAEFTRRPYGEVSLSPVIKAAGIPRGSFYQYFAGKTDLFRYVLSRCGQGMERLIMESLEACGWRLPELPLGLFDRMIRCLGGDGEELRTFLRILRQNVGVDIARMWDFAPLARRILEKADWEGLDVRGQGERLALLDLLLSSTAHALMVIACGETTPEQSRRHLEYKTAIIFRGLGTV